MIASARFKHDARDIVQTKLIYPATLAANCYEIGRAKSAVKMSRMVERLSDWPLCCCATAHIGGRLRSIAPTCCAALFRRTRIGVRFDVAPLLVHDAAQFALHRFERVVDHLVERLV
jgi:hypothetical protein